MNHEDLDDDLLDLGRGAAAGGITAAADTKDEIAKVSHLYHDAVLAGDREMLDRVVDDDGHFVDAVHAGRFDKRQLLELHTSGEMSLDTAKSKSESIRVFGDTAIELGTWEATGKWKKGGDENVAPLRIHIRYTCVWIKDQAGGKLGVDRCTGYPNQVTPGNRKC